MCYTRRRIHVSHTVPRQSGGRFDERRLGNSARPLPRGRNSSGKVRATRKVRQGEGVGALCPVLCVRAWTPAERLWCTTNALQASMQRATKTCPRRRLARVCALRCAKDVWAGRRNVTFSARQRLRGGTPQQPMGLPPQAGGRVEHLADAANAITPKRA